MQRRFFIIQLLSEALFIAVLFIIIQSMNIFVGTSDQEATFRVNKITFRLLVCVFLNKELFLSLPLKKKKKKTVHQHQTTASTKT